MASFIELARRRQLVDAAIETIAEVGLAKASNAAIAARAQVSPGLINYHFGSRQGLIDQMRATIQQRVDDAMQPGEVDDSYVSALEGMLRRFATYCLDNLPAMLVLTQFTRHDQAGGMTEDAERVKGLTELRSFITEGQDCGQFRPTDAQLVASVLMNAMTDLPREIRERGEVDRAVFERDWPLLFVDAIAVTVRGTDHDAR
ncbi:TetR family transcriptional regulator [Nocardia caishijiensis]|uniref:TetR family transcriptional regulator n=1 Tax=Nocardia caishijiensis TaxID=184756 RepID=A0ABQ6YIX8_9NOCA|nr:TetR family transcriptional regulator [Nocardia caishijiensis]